MKLKFKPTKSTSEQSRLSELAGSLEGLARMVRQLAIANDRSEPVMLVCLRQRIPAAATALLALQAEFGEQDVAMAEAESARS